MTDDGPKRGGRRKGAGRPKVGQRVPHARRPDHAAAHPVHLTIRAVRGLPSLRSHHLARTIGLAFHAAKKRGHVITQFTVQADHLHLIVEADDKVALSRGMQGLAIRAAKAIDRAVGRKGKVFFDRYFPRTMTFPQQVRRGLVYVLNNYLHHGDGEPIHGAIDPFSSAAHFDGWRYDVPPSVPARKPGGSPPAGSATASSASPSAPEFRRRNRPQPPPAPTCHQKPRISRS
jgi:REP element-mobilizing transposase RayT